VTEALSAFETTIARRTGPVDRMAQITPGMTIFAVHSLLGGIVAQTPLLRLGTPDDIAWAAVYLASDETKFMTGQVLALNGGLYMSQ